MILASSPAIAPMLHAFLFGVTLAVAIGPIALLLVTVAANDGGSAGLRAAAGATAADLTYALAAFTAGHLILPAMQDAAGPMRLIASGALAALGLWMILRAVRAGRAPVHERARVLRRPMLQTYGLTVANPMTFLFFVSFAAQLPAAPTWGRAILLAGLVALGSLTIQLLLITGGVLLGRTFLSGRLLVGFNILSGAGIALFGLAGLWRQLAG